MSTTALVRSSSSGLISNSSPKPSTPSTTTTTVLPKLNLTPSSKSTPIQSPTPQPSTPGASTPGQWQHPRMKEVLQRQNKTNFDKSNIYAIGTNATTIALTFVLAWYIYPLFPPSTLLTLRPYDTYALLALRFYLFINISLNISPLLRQPDKMEDIPLTPAQRQLLGLPPMSRPATPAEKEQWITPPRYTRSRSGTPQSPASSLRAQASGSPGEGTPLTRQGSGSSFGAGSGRQSPSSITPLRSGIEERRRLSYNSGRSSPLGASDHDAGTSFGGLGESTSTPSRKGPRASMGLNSKWLYEKGMGSPVGRRGSNGGMGWDPKGWGTGSVFN